MDFPSPPNQPLPPAAIAALQLGRQIEAIKIVRQVHGLSLKDAKDRVDQCVAGDPVLREKFASSQAWSKNGCLVVGLGLVALLGAGAFLFIRMRG